MKIFIFAHIADCDGITPIILSKLVFEHVDYKLLDNPIHEEFLNTLKNIDINEYDYIYITDLCISEDTIKKLDDNIINKLKIFDHHIANIHMNKYDFISVIDEENGIKQCGTSLYYSYLCKYFENEFWLMTKDDFLNKYEFLGTGIKHKKIDDFVGNYVAISVAGSMIRIETFLAEGKPIKKSTHCGLTREEMAVPVIVLK